MAYATFKYLHLKKKLRRLMKHFLPTRFNVVADSWSLTKNGNQVLDEDWLSNRFELFEKYCYPSVKSQSNQDFIWAIYFNSRTPTKYLERIRSLSEGYENFQAVFINNNDELLKSFINLIEGYVKKDDDYMITTRLDNDDIIHHHFIQIIHELYKKNTGSLIDLRKGYQISIEQGQHEIRKYYASFNHFISIVEEASSFNTIISKMHYEWSNFHKITTYSKQALWVELVHGKNLKNSVNRNFSLTRSICEEDFGISQKFNKSNYYQQFVFYEKTFF